MKPKEKLHIMYGVVILLALLILYFYLESSSWRTYSEELETKNVNLNETLVLTESRLNNEIDSLNSELETTKQNLNETGSSLEQCYSDLDERSSELEVCLSRNEELGEFLSETSDELENLSAQLDAFEAQIKQSMSWFTNNSDMDTLSMSFKYQVDKCTTNTVINAACIPIVMKEEKHWSYKRDEELDDLLSLEEMSLNNGGDCEDWSLYFKAAYNYLKAEDRPERYLLSVVPGIGDFQIYGDHYYTGAEGKEVGTTDDYVYIICYDSHCIVAISDQKIKNSGDIYKLRGAPAIEPQNGQYMFTIGNLLAPDICSPQYCDYSDIWIVITDDDIYDFHYNWQWTSYKDYHEAAVYYKQRVDAMKSLVEQTAG